MSSHTISNSLSTAQISAAASNAFDTFDNDLNGTIDSREVGTVFRLLGIYPSEEQLHHYILEIQNDEPSPYVRKDRMVAVLTRVIQNGEVNPPTVKDLTKAFSLFDTTKSGLVNAEELRMYLTTSGEKFTPEEADAFIAFACDESGVINYKEYIQVAMDILYSSKD